MADENCQIIRCDSCAYGSQHLKAFLFLCSWAKTDAVSRRCSGDHEHIPVEGSFTKASATYVPDLAEALADVMADGIRRLQEFKSISNVLKCEGLESQLINEVTVSS